MSLKAEQQSDTELDHIRDTLTGIVSYASKTRGEMHHRFDQQAQELSELKANNLQLKADNAEIKEMLQALLSR